MAEGRITGLGFYRLYNMLAASSVHPRCILGPFYLAHRDLHYLCPLFFISFLLLHDVALVALKRSFLQFWCDTLYPTLVAVLLSVSLVQNIWSFFMHGACLRSWHQEWCDFCCLVADAGLDDVLWRFSMVPRL